MNSFGGAHAEPAVGIADDLTADPGADHCMPTDHLAGVAWPEVGPGSR